MGWNIDAGRIGYGIGVWPSRSSAMLPSNTTSKGFVSSTGGFLLGDVSHFTRAKWVPRTTELVRFWDLCRVDLLPRPREVLSVRDSEVLLYLCLTLGLPLGREYPEDAVFLRVKYFLLMV